MDDNGSPDPVVDEFLGALNALDWTRVRLLLHPYLHWSEGGTLIRGRNGVLQRLAERPAPAVPASVELRDGQIYRWNAATPG